MDIVIRLRKETSPLMHDAAREIERLRAALLTVPCPGGGWNGMPAELEGRATVADCMSHGCGCIYGAALRGNEQNARDEDEAAQMMDNGRNTGGHK
jgi:hypothetical protein